MKHIYQLAIAGARIYTKKSVLFAAFLLCSLLGIAQIQSAQSGNWSSPATWVGGVVPTDNQTVVINSGHTVSISAGINREATTTVNGTFQILAGSFVTGGAGFEYAATGSELVISHGNGFNYDLNSSNLFWTSSSNPYIVTIFPNSPVRMQADFTGREVQGLMYLYAGLTLQSAGLLSFETGSFLNIHNGGFIANNSPNYQVGSTLEYRTGGNFQRSREWNTSGGYIPHNVRIANNTTVQFDNPTYPGNQQINGQLDIQGGSSLYMDNNNSFTGKLQVNGLLNLAGTLRLGESFGEDLELGGSFLTYAGCNFEPYTRAVIFTNLTGGQTIFNSKGSPLQFDYIVLRKNNGASPAFINIQHGAGYQGIQVTGVLGGTAIDFNNAGDYIDFENSSLHIGMAGKGFNIDNLGSLRGGSLAPFNSSLKIEGIGNIGEIKFDPGYQNVGVLDMNTTGVDVGFVLTSPLTIHSNLTLNSGRIQINNNDISFGTAATVTGGNDNSFILLNGTGKLIKNFNNTGLFKFPVGNGNEYAPADIDISEGNFAAGASLTIGTTPNRHPANNISTTYINRYWSATAVGMSNLNADMNFYYRVGDVNLAISEATMRGAGYNGTNWLQGPLVNTATHSFSMSGLSDIRGIYTAGNVFSPTASTDHYRSITNGAWNSTTTWSSSPNTGGPFVPATAAPDKDAQTITIMAGHNVQVSTAINFDELLVNGTLTLLSGGVITIFDGAGTDMTVGNGGKIVIANTSPYNTSVLAGTSQSLVRTGGLIQVSAVAGSGATGYEMFARNTNNIWENSSTYQHNSAAASLTLTGGVTVFPNAASNIIPIFRVDALSGNYTSSSNITLNGLLEVNTNLNIAGTGSKIFRKGWSGNGTILLDAANGAVNFTDASTISGNLTLDLRKHVNILSEMTIPSGSTITNISNTAATTPNFEIDAGKTFLVAAFATFSMGSLSTFSGSSNTALINNQGIFKTAHPNGFGGITGSIAPPNITHAIGSTIEYNGSNQILTPETYYHLIVSGGGTKTGSAPNIHSAGSVTITGTTILDATGNLGSTASNTTALTMNGASRFIIRRGGSQPNMDGAYTLNAPSVIEFASTVAQTIKGTPSRAYSNIDVSGTNVSNSSGDINLKTGAAFRVLTGGIYSQTSGKIITASGSADPTISVLVQDGATFNVGITEGFNGVPQSAIQNLITNITLQPNSTVNYSRLGTQTITNANGLVYGNLVLSGSGVKTAPASTLDLKGSFTSNLSGPGNLFGHNNGTVSFSNITAAQSYTAISGSPVSFHKLETQNEAGLQMTSDAVVENELKLLTPATKMSLSGSVILRSTPSATASVAALPPTMATDPFTYNAAGGFVVERYLPGYKSWRLLATPFQSTGSPSIYSSWQEEGSLTSAGYGVQISSPLYPAGSFDYHTPFPALKVYNPATNVYDAVTNTTTTPIANRQGYYLFVRGDRLQGSSSLGFVPTTLRIKGRINTLTQLPYNIGPMQFATYGNPYPSRVSFASLTKNQLANGFTAWDPAMYGAYGVGGFVNYVWNGSTYAPTVGAPRDFLESGEAVFVQNNTANPGSITASEAAKGIGSAVVSRNTVNDPSLKISLHTNDASGNDYIAAAALIQFDPTNSNGLDNEDFRKIMNSTENLCFVNGTYNLEVERRQMVNENDILPLLLTRTKQQAYTFDIEATNINAGNLQAYLADAYTLLETPVSLTGTTSVSFTVNADAGSYASNRFKLIFKLNTVLPVSFTGIAATRNADNTVTVSWNTENETGMQDYVVEQSLNGTAFTAIGNKMPLNTNAATVYTFLDANASNAVNYYRIRSLSSNSVTKYSAIAKVHAVGADALVKVVPNPVTDGIIRLQATIPAGKYVARLYDTKGALVAEQSLMLVTGSMATINANALPAGLYELVLNNQKGENISVKVSIQQ